MNYEGEGDWRGLKGLGDLGLRGLAGLDRSSSPSAPVEIRPGPAFAKIFSSFFSLLNRVGLPHTTFFC